VGDVERLGLLAHEGGLGDVAGPVEQCGGALGVRAEDLGEPRGRERFGDEVVEAGRGIGEERLGGHRVRVLRAKHPRTMPARRDGLRGLARACAG